MPGQNLAAGEKPSWAGKRHRLHHALRFGDKLWAGCWHAGVRVIDVSDIRAPKQSANTTTTRLSRSLRTLSCRCRSKSKGRRIALAIDEEDHAHDEKEVERRRGRPHGCLWVLDVTDLAHIKPLSIYEVSELDSPWSRATPGRFGAHQFQEHMKDTLVYCAWFAGGLRIVDIADPFALARSATSSPNRLREKPHRRLTTSTSIPAASSTSSTATPGSTSWSSSASS